MTEPEAGSAVTDLKTTATPDGDGYRINGVKVFTTHAAVRRGDAAYVRFGPGVGGIGSVLIDTRCAGRSLQGSARSSCRRGMGRRSTSTTCYVPPENVVLKEGGFKKQIAGFNVERIGNTARSLALGRYAYERGARVGDAAQAVRPPAVRVPGPAVEVRRHEDEARRRPAAALPRGGRTPTAAFRRRRRRRSPRPSATRPASTSPTRRCR